MFSKAILFQVSAEEGLKAQVGVPGLKKRSAKKGWVFFRFDEGESGFQTAMPTIVDASDLKTLQGRIEGILFTDVILHSGGIFSGKLVEGVDLSYFWGQYEILEAKITTSLNPPKKGAAVSKSKEIPPSTPESIQASSYPERSVNDVIRELQDYYTAVEGVAKDPPVSKTSGHMPGTDKWEYKSDEAKFRIWKRFARRHFKDALYRIVKNKEGHESVVSRKTAIERTKMRFFLVQGDPRTMGAGELNAIFRRAAA